MLPLVLALALSAPGPSSAAEATAARLLAARPGATALRAANGGLAHLSGFVEPRRSGGAEENARRFLSENAAAFGADDLETIRVDSAPGAPGSAVFRRRVSGLPVFGGEIAVGWRADGAITLVNGSRALATEPTGTHQISSAAATSAALAAAPFEAGEVSAEPGWIEYGGKLLPVVRVAHGGARHASWSYVDAITGELLWRTRRTRDAVSWDAPCPPGGPCIRSFLASPLDPPPASASGNPPADFALQGLPDGSGPGATLTGLRTTVFDCAGYDQNQGRADPTFPLGFPRDCETPHAITPGGTIAGGQTALFTAAAGATPAGFVADPDPTQIAITDPFAQQSAYFHIDAHSRFLDALSPAFAANGGVGLVAGYVNVRDGTGPLDNAFFSPGGGPPGSNGVMIFGQGTRADLAYDAEVLYHELTHAAVDRTAQFQGVPDPFGIDSDPDAINEGTADTFAFAHVGESLLAAGQPVDSASCLSRYFGSELGLECLRQARNERTCRGAGPNVGRNPGRTGEVHDDGEIWTGFTWELYEAAAQNGQSLPVASAMFQAMAAAGSRPSYSALAASVRQKLVEVGAAPEAEAFAACIAAQRDLAGCDDRAVPLYSGERAQGVLYGLLSSSGGNTPAGQQYVIDVPCGATALRIQAGDSAGTGSLYVRYGQPVEFGFPPLGAPKYDWLVRGNHAETVVDTTGCASCNGCGASRTTAGAGRWYFLFTGATGSVFQLGLSIDLPGGQAPPARPAFALGTCTWGAGPTPSGGSPAFASVAPALACAAPAQASTCNAISLPTGTGAKGGGCGCSHGSPGTLALAFAGLLLLRRRPRADRVRLIGRPPVRYEEGR